MTFISYAQNFEDVQLFRTLKLFGPGCYVDVGANHPRRYSVTAALYERGWRGINIEPIAAHYQVLSEERPDEVNLCCAVGEHPDEMTFYEAAVSELSTLCPEVAVQLRLSGIQVVEHVVKVMTLAEICNDHLAEGKEFHFLKIDVEGMESAVLRGMDFQRWRPWVLLIEASCLETPEWEGLLDSVGYEFAVMDGTNRYYVAREHSHLLVPLRMLPGQLDEFHLFSGHPFAAPVEDTTALRDALAKSHARAAVMEAELDRIYTSRSWRLANWFASVRKRLPAMFG